jgi:hypothetical protein
MEVGVWVNLFGAQYILPVTTHYVMLNAQYCKVPFLMDETAVLVDTMGQRSCQLSPHLSQDGSGIAYRCEELKSLSVTFLPPSSAFLSH